jgi:hypothetical protein
MMQGQQVKMMALAEVMTILPGRLFRDETIS